MGDFCFYKTDSVLLENNKQIISKQNETKISMLGIKDKSVNTNYQNIICIV